MSRRALSDNLTEQRRAETMMQRAIGLSLQTLPHPNPRVGAVVVSGDRIVGEGAHVRPGEPHAEVLALRQAGGSAKGSTVFVTLEPCSHHGRTPPCTKALIDAGVSRVIIGTIDPDARVRGSGIADLEAAGIEVVSGVIPRDVEDADPGYFHHRRTGLPRVTLKLATTIDGQIAAADRTSKWITGEAARRDGHMLRAEADAVMVGAGTVIDDDPALTVRLDGYEGRQPRPVVVAGHRHLPAEAQVVQRDALVYTGTPLDLSVEQVLVGGGAMVDLRAVLKDLGARNYVDVLVEGGATLAKALVQGDHVDRIVFYLAAKLALGSGWGAFAGEFSTIGDAVPIEIVSIERVGEDVRIDTRLGR